MIHPTSGISPLARTRRDHHPDCFVCSAERSFGLRVDYRPRAAGGGVEADVDCPRPWQGYTGTTHGGIVAALVDGAMTHCLFAESIVAVTARLEVRYRHPLAIDQPAHVVAEIVRRSAPLYIIEARITQARRLRVTATGSFMRQNR